MATNPLTPRVNNIETGGTWKIGDVKQSFLTEVEFQAEHDDTWVLCDGRDVIGSDYAILKEGDAVTSHNIPDARGQFLRGWSDDASVDPDGPRAPGSGQEDKMQGHRHEDGDGWETVNMYAGTGGAMLYKQNGIGSTANLIADPISDGVNGTPRTGLETRPKNIAVNMFIKINREPSS